MAMLFNMAKDWFTFKFNHLYTSNRYHWKYSIQFSIDWNNFELLREVYAQIVALINKSLPLYIIIWSVVQWIKFIDDTQQRDQAHTGCNLGI